MNYEKKYKDALERAREIHNEHRAQCFDVMVKVFPELKESEDERIRKGIIQYLEQSQFGEEHYQIDDDVVKNYIAWLEKQGKTSWMPSKEEMDVLYGLAYITNEFDEQKEEVITRLYQDLKRVFFNGASFENMFPTNTSTELEKQGEQKITDKVEPKFKVGDWVVQGCNIMKIRCIGNEYYCFETVGGYVGDMFVSEVDSLYHLWTIQDAKDGDVLKEDSCVFIVEKMKSEGTAITYCCLFDDGDFDLGSTLSFDVFSTHPATKEQRVIFFQKMHEAGYEWDSEKKELRKIGQKSAWSEEDEKKRKGLIKGLEDKMGFGWASDPFSREEYINWLKSLKDRVQL